MQQWGVSWVVWGARRVSVVVVSVFILMFLSVMGEGGHPPLLPGCKCNGCTEIAEVIPAKYVQPNELRPNMCSVGGLALAEG